MDLANFEFFHFVMDVSKPAKLPDMFAKLLEGREPQQLKVREVDDERSHWEVEVLFDGGGRMFLGPGWKRFALSYGLKEGDLLVFLFDGIDVLTVKVFDGTMCRKHYHYDSIPDSILDQFVVFSKGVLLDNKQKQALKNFCAEEQPTTPVYICSLVKSHIEDVKGKMYFNLQYTQTYLESRLTTDGTDVKVFYAKGKNPAEVRMKLGEDGKAIMTSGWLSVSQTQNWEVGDILMFRFRSHGKSLKVVIEKI